MFVKWINSADHMPYNSCGNGSAIRSAYIGCVCDSIEEVEKLAEISAQISHNHPDGIAGAKAVAGTIYLLRTGVSKNEVRRYISKFYDMNFTLRSISSPIEFNATCQYTVPYAIAAVLENNSYIDTIRAACSIGGDMDTIPCIAGSIAGVIYNIPDNLKNKTRSVVGDRLSKIIDKVTLN
jgi:ADP-ribosylglycohydrolase